MERRYGGTHFFREDRLCDAKTGGIAQKDHTGGYERGRYLRRFFLRIRNLGRGSPKDGEALEAEWLERTLHGAPDPLARLGAENAQHGLRVAREVTRRLRADKEQ